MLWMFLMMLTVIVTFVLGTVFGYKRATQYRQWPVFQYAMMIAHSAPEEWEQKSNGLHHPELGHLSHRGPWDKGGGFLNGETIPLNLHNQLRNVIRDGHLRLLMRKRTERIARETAEAVAKLKPSPPPKKTVPRNQDPWRGLKPSSSGPIAAQLPGSAVTGHHELAKIVAYQVYLMDGRKKNIPVTWYKQSKNYRLEVNHEEHYRRPVETRDVPNRRPEHSPYP